jgi:hypothetical protein
MQVEIIDTPGYADFVGVRLDKSCKEKIIHFLKSTCTLNTVVFVKDGTNPELGHIEADLLNTMRLALGQQFTNKFVVVLTKVGNGPSWDNRGYTPDMKKEFELSLVDSLIRIVPEFQVRNVPLIWIDAFRNTEDQQNEEEPFQLAVRQLWHVIQAMEPISQIRSVPQHSHSRYAKQVLVLAIVSAVFSFLGTGILTFGRNSGPFIGIGVISLCFGLATGLLHGEVTSCAERQDDIKYNHLYASS